MTRMKIFIRSDGNLKSRLLEWRVKGKFTDINIVCHDMTILLAHKTVLCTNPIFDSLMRGSLVRAANKIDQVNVNFDSKIMATVLDWVYLGEQTTVQVENLDQAETLLRAADAFCISALFERCCEIVERIMTTLSFPKIFDWDRNYQKKATAALLDKCGKKFWLLIMSEDSYLDYDIQQFSRLVNFWCEAVGCHKANAYSSDNEYFTLESENPKHGEITREETRKIFTRCTELYASRIVKWVNKDVKERDQYTTSLFSQLHIPRLSKCVLKELLAQPIVMNNCHVAKQLLIGIIE